MSISTTCARGTKRCAETPLQQSAATISPGNSTSRQTDPTVKPPIDARKSFFGRSDRHSQPVSGVAIAAATMYAVNTQAILILRCGQGALHVRQRHVCNGAVQSLQ